MFILCADKNELAVRQREPVTSGSVNAYQVRFEFSLEWEGLKRTAVFKAGTEIRSILLDESGVCVIPWEVLTVPDRRLMAGVCGARDGELVLPTIWAGLGTILEGVTTGEEHRPPTPELWEQAMEGTGDGRGYTQAGELGLYAGKRLLSSVPVMAGTGEGGATDHRMLSHRDAEEQHPISSITGLADELGRIPEPVEPLTNEDLEEILR